MDKKRMEELKKLKAKKLREILKRRGVDYSDCLEKSDFIKKIIDSDGQEEKEEKFSISSSKKTIAGSKCIVVENSQSTYDVAVIICHGFGANEEDLAKIGEQLLNDSPKLKTKKVRFIFPRAPVEVASGQYAWWPLNFQMLMYKGLQFGIDKVFEGPPPDGADAALQHIIKLVQETKKQTNLPTSRIILGGFSQGSWLMTDVMFSLEESIGALVVYSGALFRREKWAKIANKRRGTKVIQTHGKMDSMLPFMCGDLLKKFFEKQGMDLDFTAFSGDHTIPEAGIQKLHDVVLAVSDDK